jgi:hypothetical protein
VGERLGARAGFAGGGAIALATGLVGLWSIGRRRELATTEPAVELAVDPA